MVYGCQCLEFLTCSQMLMHAHGGCTDTVRESAPEVVSGSKISFRPGDSNLCQYGWRLGFQSDALPTELFPPHVCWFYERTSMKLIELENMKQLNATQLKVLNQGQTRQRHCNGTRTARKQVVKRYRSRCLKKTGLRNTY